MVQPAGREQRMQALYDELPHIECKRMCRECCGPVIQSGSLTRLEFDRLAGVAPSPVDPKDFMACSLLNGETGECRVYDLRPMICRLWGLSTNMVCPAGCVPDRWLSPVDVQTYLRRAEEIGGNMLSHGVQNEANQQWLLRTAAHMASRFLAKHPPR